MPEKPFELGRRSERISDGVSAELLVKIPGIAFYSICTALYSVTYNSMFDVGRFFFHVT
jgi:hypothetical protein